MESSPRSSGCERVSSYTAPHVNRSPESNHRRTSSRVTASSLSRWRAASAYVDMASRARAHQLECDRHEDEELDCVEDAMCDHPRQHVFRAIEREADDRGDHEHADQQ